MVEWLLSDEPLRLYTEFSRSKAAENDSRLKLLTAVPGRFEKMVSKWLGYQRKNNAILLQPLSLLSDAIMDGACTLIP